MPPNRFESEVESFLEGSHGDRTHIKRADHHTVTPLCGTLLARCIVGVSAASKNQEAKEKPPLHEDPAPRMKHFPPLHGDRAPRMKHFSPLHGMDRAIMKFSSPTHTQNAQFPTIFSVLGRYFFHTGTQTTMRCYAGAIFLSCNPWKHPGVADTGGTEHTSRRRAWPRSRKVTVVWSGFVGRVF